MTEPDKINEEQDSRISDSVSEKMKLYNQKLIEHGKSKSIRATPFDIKGKLMKRLYKMSAVIDLRYTYMNKKVGEMK